MTVKSVLDNLPQNSNLLEGARFTYVCPSLRYSTWFITACQLPAINQTPVQVSTPMGSTWRHGDELIYDELTFTFMVDEDLRAWTEIHDWMRGLTFPVSLQEYARQKKKGLYADGTLLSFKNSMVQNVYFKFYNSFPIALSTIQYNTADDGSIAVSADVTFRYDYFDIQRIDT